LEISIPLPDGLELRISDGPDPDNDYPSSRLKKAFRLFHHGRCLAQEAVGFGFPLVKMGLAAFFPGAVELSSRRSGPEWKVTARYTLNLTEKTVRHGQIKIRNDLFYSAKNAAAMVIRRVPPLRGVLTGASSVLRKTFGWETIFDEADFSMDAKVAYTISEKTGSMHVEVDVTTPKNGAISEVVVMNEQGALYFDHYSDSSGIVLQGNDIGCWDRVMAREAVFRSREAGIGFSLSAINGAQLYRGRELIDRRLAWAGFGYSVKPEAGALSYVLKIGKDL
jgi:hypothetical protein